MHDQLLLPVTKKKVKSAIFSILKLLTKPSNLVVYDPFGPKEDGLMVEMHDPNFN